MCIELSGPRLEVRLIAAASIPLNIRFLPFGLHLMSGCRDIAGIRQAFSLPLANKIGISSSLPISQTGQRALSELIGIDLVSAGHA